MTKHVIVIGGGYSGMAASYELAKAGIKVTLLEADAELGGLAGAFELSPGYRVEKFYHHWFSSDRAILGFLEELGLSSRIKFRATNTGLYFANHIFRLAGPRDLLSFTPLPLSGRIRTGLMALYARRLKDWKPLENQSAAEWIIKVAGKQSYEVIWQPLLAGKFGAEAENVSAVWFWNKLKLRGSSRKAGGAEQLAYFEGGFGAATDAVSQAISAAGVDVHKTCAAQRILINDSSARGAATARGDIEADAVLCTAPLPTFLELAPELPPPYRQSCEKIRFLGNVCMVLRLKKSFSETYWLNVADPSFPFVGIIEHTNFDDKSHYGGEHIAYLSKYLPVSDPLFAMDAEEFFNFAEPYIKRIFPDFSRDWLLGVNLWKAEYSQPVITKGYSALIPPQSTPIRNLWLSTMAQVYPEDRGTNYAVLYARRVAGQIAKSLS